MFGVDKQMQTRMEYIKKYKEFFGRLVLNDKLISTVKKYDSGQLWEKKNPTDAEIKSHILLKLTQNSYSCKRVVRMLRESENEANTLLAEEIESFNKPRSRSSK